MSMIIKINFFSFVKIAITLAKIAPALTKINAHNAVKIINVDLLRIEFPTLVPAVVLLVSQTLMDFAYSVVS